VYGHRCRIYDSISVDDDEDCSDNDGDVGERARDVYDDRCVDNHVLHAKHQLTPVTVNDCSTSGPNSVDLTFCIRLVAEPSRYATNHPGQLSLAIPPWVGAMSTSESWDVNRCDALAMSRSVNWCLAEG